MVPLNFTPFPTLTTERIVLRQMTNEDDKDIFILRADPSVSEFISRAICTSIDDARQFINKINTGIGKNEWAYWGIALKENNRIIGTACLWNFAHQHSRGEIGYELLPDFQGKGLGQEAVAAVIDYGFKNLELHSMEAVVYPANTPSIKLLEKNGFVREAYFKENNFFNGKYIDTAIYSRLNS